MERKWTAEYAQLNIISTFAKPLCIPSLLHWLWSLINEINPSAKIFWFSSVFLTVWRHVYEVWVCQKSLMLFTGNNFTYWSRIGKPHSLWLTDLLYLCSVYKTSHKILSSPRKKQKHPASFKIAYIRVTSSTNIAYINIKSSSGAFYLIMQTAM